MKSADPKTSGSEKSGPNIGHNRWIQVRDGAIYGQGPEWQTCRPAGFLSKKFSVAQQHYRTHKHETIAVLEALMKWEGKLLGRKFTLVTDHQGLEYFETQKNLSDRQVRWWEFLSGFNFTIMHVDGVDNKIADCLSRYYENDTGDKNHPERIYVNADARLDPDSELLPTDRYMELKTAATRRSSRLAKKKEAQIMESEEMNDSAQQALQRKHRRQKTTTLSRALQPAVTARPCEPRSKAAWISLRSCVTRTIRTPCSLRSWRTWMHTRNLASGTG
jgi:RNase H-like domain found in reverse transcriptase